MKRLLLYISDGLGCRNFVYTTFIDHAKENGFEVVILQNVDFGFNSKNCSVINFPKLPIPPFIDILKNAKIEAELNLYAKKFNNDIYHIYNKSVKPKRLRHQVKYYLKNYIAGRAKTESSIRAIEDRMYKNARNAPVTIELEKLLREQMPTVVMFTNQRSITNIPILLAAGKLGIPTITNIYSWDNLPKATKIHRSDYYFAWSQYMYHDLLKYYPYISKDTIRITGTPQFSTYTDQSDLVDRKEFCSKYSLDPNNYFVCFTGNDFTSSPYDHIFLNDLSRQVAIFNSANHEKFHVIFRSSPVDFSNRYDETIEKNKDVVTAIRPLWNNASGRGWQSCYPLIEDTAMLKNLLNHSDLVANFGSTIAIDASFFDTPSCYLKYQPNDSAWSGIRPYRHVHFDTIGDLKPVYWILDKNDFQAIFRKVIDKTDAKTIIDAKKWAQIVIQHPIDKVHERMWNEIKNISK